jgi:hypothetical protein
LISRLLLPVVQHPIRRSANYPGGERTANSTSRSDARKPIGGFSARKHAAGVPADFRWHIHESGRWAKKVRGQRRDFGSVAEDFNGEAALESKRAKHS